MILALVLTSALLGAIASLRDPEKGLGREFLEGIHAIGPIFLATSGIMASIPLLSKGIEKFLSPLFQIIGADSAMAATTVIAVDMGGYQLAQRLASSTETWILAMFTGYVAGATIVFSIPVGLTLLPKKHHRVFALGTLSGLLAIPFAVLISTAIAALLSSNVRTVIDTQGPATHTLAFAWTEVLMSVAPLALFMIVLAITLYFFTEKAISAFMIFGRFMEVATRLVLVFCVIQHFSGFFTSIGIPWPFDPLLADSKDLVRALEIAGYIGLMLSGAFPLVYLLKKGLERWAERIGRVFGLGHYGALAVVAASANILALFRLFPDLDLRDKILTAAYAVCAAFLLGDHLAFTMNFQPTLFWPVFGGKLFGGIIGLIFARFISLPKAYKLGLDRG